MEKYRLPSYGVYYNQITFPWGNFLRKFSCLLVTPNSNAGSTLTSDPLYLAAMSTLYARKLFEYVYRV